MLVKDRGQAWLHGCVEASGLYAERHPKKESWVFTAANKRFGTGEVTRSSTSITVAKCTYYRALLFLVRKSVLVVFGVWFWAMAHRLCSPQRTVDLSDKTPAWRLAQV